MSIKHIRIASDLHLEAFSGRNAEVLALDFLPRDDRDSESILVLAGDISSQDTQLIPFLKACCVRFPRVFYVAGNHEFYRHDYVIYSKEIKAEILAMSGDGGSLQNLECAFDDVGYEELEDLKIRLIFTPLWADGGPTLMDQGRTGFYLNDFRLITMPMHDDPHYRPSRKFSVEDMMRIHKEQKAEILRLLETPFDGRSVVITHHLPSRRLVSARFWPGDGSDGANGGFASNCDNMICTLEPWLWIHGHTHDTIDTELWKTRIICNPAGYRGEYATAYNSFMDYELREDGTRRAIVVPKFVDL
jgi:hypothetical protein